MTIQLRNTRAMPYALPVATLSKAALGGVQVAADRVLQHPCFGEITILAENADHHAKMTEEIVFTLAGETISLRCQRSLLTAMLRRCGFEADQLPLRADPSLAGLVLEHLLTPALAAFEQAQSTDIEVSCVQPVGSDTKAQGQINRLQILWPLWYVLRPIWPVKTCVELQAWQPSGDALLRGILEQLTGPPATPPMHVTASIALISPGFQVPFADLLALDAGDALVLDSRWTPQTDARITIAGLFTAAGAWRGDRFSLTSVPLRQKAKDTLPMTSKIETDFTVNDIPVTVTIELDRIDLPFSTIATLKAGSLLPFGTPLPETVRVMANGRQFATATLVQIDNQFGIRISAMTGTPV
jgi:type III secretion system YscQ/HrcQ family protein